jgi:hypothetical protein
VAPVKTAYVAAATSLTYAEESASAGKYTLEVAVPGKNVQTAGIDLTSEDDTGRTFGFAP